MSSSEQVTACLLQAWQTGQRQSPQGLSLASVDEAYRVQQQVGEVMGWFEPGARNIWKLGFSASGFSAARVPDQAIFASGWKIPDGYCYAQGIEAEIIVQLGDALSPSCSLPDARCAIDCWMPGIELCDTRWQTGVPANDLLKLADNQLNRALIVGSPQPFTPVALWDDIAVCVTIDEQLQISNRGSHPLGDPLAALPWLAHHAALQGHPLRAGDWIATGSWSGLYWADKNAQIQVTFGHHSRVQLHT